MTSRERHVVWNHRQLDCLMDNLFGATRKESNHHITGPLWGESTAKARCIIKCILVLEFPVITASFFIRIPAIMIEPWLSMTHCQRDTCDINHEISWKSFPHEDFFLRRSLQYSHCLQWWRKTIPNYCLTRKQSLKTEGCHNVNFAVIGGTGGCPYDNLLCHQWRQSWHHDNPRLSVI